jgi:hypothetical protein
MGIHKLISIILLGIAFFAAQSAMAVSIQESVKQDEQRLLGIFEQLQKTLNWPSWSLKRLRLLPKSLNL